MAKPVSLTPSLNTATRSSLLKVPLTKPTRVGLVSSVKAFCATGPTIEPASSRALMIDTSAVGTAALTVKANSAEAVARLPTAS